MTATDKPSIAELQRRERVMTVPPWQSTVWYSSDEGGHAAVGPHHRACDDRACDHATDSSCSDLERARADADGLAALRNAAPALLEIVAAAMAWSESYYGEDRAEVDALLAALAKVRP